MFKTALEDDPDNELARFSLANELFDDGQYVEALEHFQLALEHDAEWMRVYIQIGKCHANSNNKDEALKALEKARELMVKQNDFENEMEIQEILDELS